MTISYSGGLRSLLFRWKGSLWKGVWRQLLAFLLLYYAIRLLYQFVLDTGQRHQFEQVALTIDQYTQHFPITFLLGFYISTVVSRWWSQFEWVAWPDDLLSLLCLLVAGQDHYSRLKRHTVARYLNLTAALAWREVSLKVRQRFPTVDHLMLAGLMTEPERMLYDSVQVGTLKPVTHRHLTRGQQACG